MRNSENASVGVGMHHARAAASSDPTAPARAVRLRRIADAIVAGRYVIDLDRLADAIAADELARVR